MHLQTQAILLYGNRRGETVMFADELADLKDAHPSRLALVHVLSREKQETELLNGRLGADKLRELLPLFTAVQDVDHWWLCGPHSMIGQARQFLLDLDVPAERIHQELFAVADPPGGVDGRPEPAADAARSDVTIVLDGRRTSLRLPRDTPILDSAQPARPDLPFACKGGVCGTCRAKVVHGQVQMRRNFALEQSEVDEGFVLTCQSLPITDTLGIDFDV